MTNLIFSLKKTSFYLGAIYYAALIIIWQLPSIATQIAIQNFFGIKIGIFNLFYPTPYLMEKCLETKN